MWIILVSEFIFYLICSSISHTLHSNENNLYLKKLELSKKYYYEGVGKKFDIQDENNNKSYLYSVEKRKNVMEFYNCTGTVESISIFDFGTPCFKAFDNCKIFLHNLEFIFNRNIDGSIISTDSDININNIRIHYTDSSFIKFTSLIKGEDNSNVIIYNSIFNNEIIKENNNMVYDGKIKSLELNNCEFLNITKNNPLYSNKKNIKRLRNSERDSSSFIKIDKCYYYKCESPYSGCITSSSSSLLSSYTLNSSFISCYQDLDERRQVITSGDNTYTNDEFRDYHSQGYDGGAFYFDGGNGYFISCVFYLIRTESWGNIGNNLGGAIYSKNGKLSCEFTNFTNCFANGGHHFLSLHFSTEIKIDNCIFDTAQGLWLGGVGIEEPSGESVISSSSINNVTATNYGAALVLQYINDILITVRDCSFENNHAGKTAAGVYFYNQTDEAKFQFNFDKFAKNTFDDVHDVCFHSDYKDKGWHSKDKFVGCVTTNNAKSIGQCGRMDGERCCDVIILDYFSEYSYSPLTVDSSIGVDQADCGRTESSIFCNTLKYVLKCFLRSEEEREVFIKTEAIEDTLINFESLKVIVNAKDIPTDKNNRPKLSLKKDESKADSLITIIEGDVTISNIRIIVSDSEEKTSDCIICIINNKFASINFSNCTISGGDNAPDSSTVYHRESAFKIVQGTVTISNIDFINFSLGNNPFFSFDYSQDAKPTFSISTCSFTNIERIEGDGCIFSDTLNGHSLNIVNMSFDNCSVLKGDGGVMNIIINSGNHLTVGSSSYSTSFTRCKAKFDGEVGGRGGGICLHVNDTGLFVLENLDFSSCEAEIEGRNVFIYSGNLYDVVTNDSIKFELEDEEKSEMAFIDDTNTTSISLSDVLDIFAPPGYVSTLHVNATDEGTCGRIKKPCLTIERVVELRFNDKTKPSEICLMNTFMFKDEVNITGQVYSFTMLEKEGEEKGEVNVGGSGSGSNEYILKIDTEVTFTGVSFHLLESIVSKIVFINIMDNTTTLDTCSVSFIEEVGKSIEYSFCCIEGGLLIMNNVNMKRVTDTVSVTKSLIIINSTGSISMNGCGFEKISLERGEGSCVNGDIGEGCKLIINSCIFGDCRTKNGNGGAIKVSVNNPGDVSITDTDFMNCEVNEGKGGGLYIDYSNCDDISSIGTFSSVIFDKCRVGTDYLLADGDYFCLVFKENKNVIDEAFSISIDGLMGSVVSYNLAIGIFADEIVDLFEQEKFYVGGTVGGDGACTSDNNCELGEAVLLSKGELNDIIYITSDITLVSEQIFSDGDIYDIKKEGKDGVNKVINVGDGSNGGALTASTSLSVSNVNIFIVKVALNTSDSSELNALYVSNGATLTLSSLKIGGKEQSPVALTKSLISLSSGCSVSMTDVTVQNVIAENAVDGLGLSFTYGTSGSLSLTRVKFENLTNERGNGGGIFVDYTGQSSLKVETLNDLTFSGMDATGVIGKNIYIVSKNEDNLHTVAKYYYDAHLLNEENLCFGYYTGIKDGIPIDLKKLLNDLFVNDTNGNDDHGCKDKDTDLCQTLKHALTKQKGDPNSVLHIVETITVRESIDISTTSGLESTNYVITKDVITAYIIIDNGFFTISQPFSISDLTIKFTTAPSSNPVFCQTTGTLSLFKVIIGGTDENNIIELKDSLMKIEGGDLIMDGESKIQNLKLDDGKDGLGINAVVENGKSFIIKSTTFENLTVGAGRNGAAFYVEFEGNDQYGAYDKNVKFINCKAKTDEDEVLKDSLYYMIIKDSLQAAADNLKDYILTSSTPKSSAIGKLGEKEADLTFYLPVDNSFFVGTDGIDGDHDCSNRQPDGNLCGTLNAGLEKQKGVLDTSVYVISSSVLNSVAKLNLNTEYKITRDREEETVVTVTDGYFVVSKSLTVSNLIFSITSLSDGFGFIQQSNGTLSLNFVIISGITGSKMNTESNAIDESLMINIDNSLISATGNTIVSLLSCIIENFKVNSADVNGGGLHVELATGKTITVTNTTFNNVRTTGYGGGMYITYTNKIYGTFDSLTTFTNCVSDKGEGNSYYVVVPSDEKFQNIADHFVNGGLLSSGTGVNEAYGEKASVENSGKDLALYLPVTNSYFTGSGGDDNNDCTNRESDGERCLKLEKGLTAQNGVSSDTLFVMTSTELDSSVTLLSGTEYKVSKNVDGGKIVVKGGSLTSSVGLTFFSINIELFSLTNSFVSQTKGILKIEGTNGNNVILGNTGSNVFTLSKPILSISGTGCGSLSYVTIQNAKSDLTGGEVVSGLGLNIIAPSDLSDTKNIKIDHVNFNNIITQGKGGALYIDYSNVNNFPTTNKYGIFDSVTFDKCRAGDDYLSADGDYFCLVFNEPESIVNTDFNTSISGLRGCVDSYHLAIGIFENDEVVDLFEQTIFFVGGTVEGDGACTKENNCKLGEAVSLSKGVLGDIIYLTSDITLSSEQLFNEGNEYDIKKIEESTVNKVINIGDGSNGGALTASTSLSISCVNVFIVNVKSECNPISISGENKKLIIVGKEKTGDEDNEEAAPAIIGGNGGNVDIISSLIKVSGKASIELKDVIIQYITLRGENKYGAALNIDEGEIKATEIDTCLITIIKVKFSKCYVESGKGGAVYISTKSDNSIKIDEITFEYEEFEANDEKVKGNFIFINTVSLIKFCENNIDFINSYEFDESKTNDIVGTDPTNYSDGVWLGYFQSKTLTECNVADGGEDVSVCGREILPCKSLKMAFDRQGDVKNVYIRDSVIVKDSIEFNETSYTVTGSSSNTIMKRENDDVSMEFDIDNNNNNNYVFNTKVNVTFNSLTFVLPSSLNEGMSLFVHSVTDSSSTLTLNNCAIEKKNVKGMINNKGDGGDGVDYSLIKLVSGNVIIDTIVIDGWTFSNGLFDIALDKDQKGVLALNNVNVSRIDNNNNILFKYTNGGAASVNMNRCTLTGIEEKEEEKEGVCSWEGSAVVVNVGIATLDGCTIANSSKGGLSVTGGSIVTIKGCTFDNNNPKYDKYSSVRRNILCSSSTLKGEEMKEKETDSLWISQNGCTFEGFDSYSSVLFIPSVSNVSYVDEANDNNTVNVTFEGNLLLPCNLSLKVIESDEENQSINYFLYSFSSFENENKAYAFISYPFLFTSNSFHSLSVSLLYPDGREGKIVESDPFIFREGKNIDDEGGGKDDDDDDSKVNSDSLMWIIIGSVSGFVLIIIIIIIIIVIIVCKKRSVPSEEEKKEEEMTEGMEVKEEIAIKPWSEEDDVQFNSSTEQSSEMTINNTFEEQEK